jgi:hypothetical protein
MKLFQSCLNLVQELLGDVIGIQVCSLLFIINVFVKTIDYCSTWANSTLNYFVFRNIATLNNQNFFLKENKKPTKSVWEHNICQSGILKIS